MRRSRLVHTFAGGGSPPMQRNNNQGYDLEESSQFLDLDLSWSSGGPRTPSPENLLLPQDRGDGEINRHLEDMRRRTQEAEFAASFQAHCVDGSAYATYEDLSLLTVDTTSAGSLGENSSSPNISGPGTPITPSSPSVLLDESFRRLNKSIESVLIEVASSDSSDDKNMESQGQPSSSSTSSQQRRGGDLSLRPLERSRSLENLRSPSYDNESTLCLAGEAVVRRHTGELNNNDNEEQQQGNTSACATDDTSTNLLRELGPRATILSEHSDNTTGTNASRVVIDEPLIEPSFVDAEETCLVTPVLRDDADDDAEPNHRHPPPRWDDDGSEEDEGTDIDKASRHSVNPGIIHPSDVVSLGTSTTKSPSELVDSTKEDIPLVISEDSDDEGKIMNDKMMAKMPHDIVMAPAKETPKTITGGGGTSQPNFPSMNAIIEAVRNNQTDVIAKQLREIEERLETAECMADDLLDQNTALRSEVTELELEVEEAKDHYRQSDVDEFRELKADLDRAIKDYRVLQYRLRKAERKSEEAENQKQQFEEKLKSSGGGPREGSGDSTPDDERSTEMIGLQQELKVAKEVSIRLHQELEMIEDKRAKTDEENTILRQKLVESEAIRKDMKRDLEKTRTEVSCTLG